MKYYKKFMPEIDNSDERNRFFQAQITKISQEKIIKCAK